MPAIYPLSVYRGDSGAWRFVLWSDTDRTVPVDLTGVTVEAQIRDGADTVPPTPLSAEVTLPNTIDVTLEAADSQNALTGRWDLQLTYGDGTVLTVVGGPARVTRDITQ